MISNAKTWLWQRGLLHDACVTSICISGDDMLMTIDDEWANERGLTRDCATKTPVTLRFTNASKINVKIESLQGARIGELVASDDQSFLVSFCDGQLLRFDATGLLTDQA